ncbi:putative transposase [Sphingomonas sp. PL20]|jgi:putative transposase
MKRKQFSEEQIIGTLKEAKAGAVVTDLCRRHGMSSATYYAWKAKFGGAGGVRCEAAAGA